MNQRLAAAQTARHAARRAFNDAVAAAIDAATARGLRSMDAIDAAVDADPAVIAARAVSKAAADELAAAEAAATSAERLDLVEHSAREAAASLPEPVFAPAVRDHDEDLCVVPSEPSEPESAAPVAAEVIEAPAAGTPAALWAEVSALSVDVADAEYTALRDRRAALYATATGRRTRGPGTPDAEVRRGVSEASAARAEYDATELRAHLLSRRSLGLHPRGCSLCAQVTGDPGATREAQRAAARALLAHVASGPWPSRVEAAADLVREAILSDALAAAEGSRTVTAEALGVTDERVAEALRRYPHLAAEWPGRRGRPAKR